MAIPSCFFVFAFPHFPLPFLLSFTRFVLSPLTLLSLAIEFSLSPHNVVLNPDFVPLIQNPVPLEYNANQNTIP